MTDEELRAKQKRKKEAQSKAWKKWYRSPKGRAWLQRRKEREALKDQT